MLNETFYINGVDAKAAGIYLQRPIEFSEPVPVVSTEKIPGRNGELIYATGSYENRTGKASCFAMRLDGVEVSIRAINKYLMVKRGYQRLETSDDPSHYWLAAVKNGARIEQRARSISPFEISFNCKPQRFLKSGMQTVVMNDGGILYNQYGFDALPLITVYGSGSGTISVGNREIEILSMEDVVCIDCDTQNAYNDRGNQNNKISALEFPVLTDGENHISWTGDIDRVDITPRWWEL